MPKTGPPRLLLGAALLFWGGMTERAVPALAFAMLLEGAHWTRLRWDFKERSFLAGWRLSVLLLLFAMVLMVVQGEGRNAMAKVFSWLPAILLPLQFVQSYGLSRDTTLGTFSMMVRRRREHARKYGLPFREVRFSFGHVYFCSILLAASLGELSNSPAFFPGLMILVSWAVVGAGGWSLPRVGLALPCALALAAVGGWGGQVGMSALYHYVTQGRFPGDNDMALRERQTALGSLGTIKQSPEIKWRLIPEQGPLPKLIRAASYGTYWAPHWQVNQLPDQTVNFHEDFQSPQTLANPANPDDPDDKFFIAPPDLEKLSNAIDPALPRFRLRGSIPGDGGLLPLPSNAAALHQFESEEFERNSFGTFRVKPSQPVCDASVKWGEAFATEKPPWESVGAKKVNGQDVIIRPDLQIPKREAAMLKEVAGEIGLHEAKTTGEKIALLQRHFIGNFSYTRYNRVPRDLEEWSRRDKGVRGFIKEEDPTLLGTFLQYTRAGHCEFFATASALLLREAGVPTRYVTGFAVMEFDRRSGEALVRGTHAHAWCRAWDEASKSWIDVDLTPPSWGEVEVPQTGRFQAFSDWVQLRREDLLVWRDRPGNMAIVTAVLLAPLLIGLVFIGRNLWRSRSRIDGGRAGRAAATLTLTPLAELEKPARKLLGERPPGMPLGPWLGQLAPRLSEPAVLTQAVELHQRLRFDPASSGVGQLEELKEMVARLRRDLAAWETRSHPSFDGR
jgi:hypothetical protein